MLLRSKTHWLRNPLLKPLLQEFLNTSTSVSYPQPHVLHFNGNSIQPVSTRRHLDTLALWCLHNSTQFFLLYVWELAPSPVSVKVWGKGCSYRFVIEGRALMSRNCALRKVLSNISGCFSQMLQIKTGRSIKGVWKLHFSRESWMMLFMSANLKDSWFVIALPISIVF